MRLPRFIGIVDLGIITIVLVTVVLPAREMFGFSVLWGKKNTPAAQFELALAEARTIAKPDDGRALEDYTRKLDAAGFKDWAIDVAVRGSARTKHSPTQWRALLATSVAYVDHLDVIPALDYANRALNVCHDAQRTDDQAVCPSWEEVRMQLYQEHLDAGVKSGIDPHRDPIGFRKAGERGLREIRLGGHDVPPPSGSGSSGSAAP